MNLQELQNKLKELFDGDYANENNVNMNNFVLYAQEIKKQEPIENIIDILDNSKNEVNIYIDFDKSKDMIWFSQFSTNDFFGIDIKFIMPFSKISSQTNPVFSIQTDSYGDKEDFLESEWPNNYILFDEKLFNKFMNLHDDIHLPEFMNWKSSPWRGEK